MISKEEIRLVNKITKKPFKRDVSRLVVLVAKSGRIGFAFNLLHQARKDRIINHDEFYKGILKINKWPSPEAALLFCIKMGDTEQYKTLACCYADNGMMNQALNACEEYLSRHDSIECEVTMATVLANLGRNDEARELFRCLMDADKQSIRDKAICDMAFLEIRAGNRDEALKLAAKVDYPPVESAHQWGTLMKMQGKHKEAVAKMRRLLKSRMTENLRKTILFSIGAILDDMGEYQEAFAAFRGGNKLKAAKYDRGREVRTLDGMKLLFNKDDFTQTLAVAGDNGEARPIFIVGMPRSGTSLVEQIIASHSKIAGKGELDCAGRHSFTCNDLKSLTTEALQECRDKYLACAGIEGGLFTDKMPANYAMIGSLALMFPGAKFINVQRNLYDLAVAIWSTDFAQPHPYAYDIDDIRFKMDAHREYIEHWKSIGIDILDVRYEDVVTDTEKTVKGIFRHIGVDPEEQCFTPHTSGRVIKTASWEQVRQPIHSRSVGRAGNYPWLFDINNDRLQYLALPCSSD